MLRNPLSVGIRDKIRQRTELWSLSVVSSITYEKSANCHASQHPSSALSINIRLSVWKSTGYVTKLIIRLRLFEPFRFYIHYESPWDFKKNDIT